MPDVEQAIQEVLKYGKIVVNQIICLGGEEICEPCRNREDFARALYNLENIMRKQEVKR